MDRGQINAKVWMSISLDLDIFEKKYFAVILFYDYVSFDLLNREKNFSWIPLIYIKESRNSLAKKKPESICFLVYIYIFFKGTLH